MTTVRIPCSTSNLGPGFDALGLALNRYLTLSAEETPGAQITLKGRGREVFPTDETNLVFRTVTEFYRTYAGRELIGLSLTVDNDVPLNGGLGSSGAAIMGGAVLANALSGAGLGPEELLNFAVRLEGHPDNVSAALLGGLTINCYDGDRLRSRSIPIADGLMMAVVMPDFQVLTRDARRVLPASVPFFDAVHNVEKVAYLVAALQSGDFDALRYTTSDRLHEPYRAQLIPGYAQVKAAGLGAGALAVNISGSGSTVIAFGTTQLDRVGQRMVQAFEASGVKAAYDLLRVCNRGAVVLESARQTA